MFRSHEENTIPKANYIFFYFVLIGLEWDSITLFTNNELFFFQNSHFKRPQACHFVKKETLAQLVFSCEFCKISKITFYKTALVAVSDSLKPFKFEPKTNIRDINSSSSDDEEEGESKTDNSMITEWCKHSAKAVLGRCSSK